MTDGIRSLWSEVVRRAILDVQGKGPVICHNNFKRNATQERKKAYRDEYKAMYKRNALYFIKGGGNWEMACNCLGRNPEEYTKEILGGLNGIRQTAKRHAPCGRRWLKKPANANADTGTKRHEGKKGLSKDLENGLTRERGVPQEHMAPESSHSEGLRGVSFAGDTAGACEYSAV